MSQVRVKVFPAQDNHGQLELDMNYFLKREEVSYVGHTVTSFAKANTIGMRTVEGDHTVYAGAIAYQDKVQK